MSDDRPDQRLSADHEALADRLAAPAPTDDLVRRMKRRLWRKTLVVAAASLAGFLFACAQFPTLNAMAGEETGGLLVLAAAAVIALVLGAVAFSLPDVD